MENIYLRQRFECLKGTPIAVTENAFCENVNYMYQLHAIH